MGTSAQAFVLLGSNTISMKLLLACLLPLALSAPEADPHYGHTRHQPQCRTVYDTVRSSACRTVTDSACTTRIITSTRTETRQDCTTVTEQKCDTTTREVAEEQCAIITETECNDVVSQVPEQVCETVEEEVCNDEAQCTTETQVIPETTFREECQDIVSNVCQEVQTQVRVAQHVVNHPSVVAAPATAVGPLVGALGLNPPNFVVKREAEAEPDPQFLINGFGGLGLGGRVVGVAGPVAPVGVAGAVPVGVAGAVAPVGVAPVAVAAPQCQQKVERQCRSVPVQTSRTVSIPRCQSVPVCVPVPKCVTVPHCVEVPVCVPVPRELVTPHCVTVPRCVTVPKCSPVERQVCQVVQKDVTNTVCTPKAVNKCNTVLRKVPEVNCVAVPRQSCKTVPFSVPVETPVEECSPVTRQVCQPVNKQVARKVCSRQVRGHGAKLISTGVAPSAISRHGTTGPSSYSYGDGNSHVSVTRGN